MTFLSQFRSFFAYFNLLAEIELIARIQESKFKWINSNMEIDLGPHIGQLPAFEIIKVRGGGQERTVGIVGLLTDDRALYRPGAFNNAVIADVFESADRMQELLYKEHKVDLVIPMTHQVPLSTTSAVPCRAPPAAESTLPPRAARPSPKRWLSAPHQHGRPHGSQLPGRVALMALSTPSAHGSQHPRSTVALATAAEQSAANSRGRVALSLAKATELFAAEQTCLRPSPDYCSH